MAKFTRDDVDKFHDYSLYIPQRTVYMGSEEYSLTEGESGTDGLMAERTIKNLTILEALNQNPITIIMNNIGGDEYHGLAIYDAIKACKSYVTIKVMGHAMSMGSIILQAADSRIMAPNSRQMIHYGQWCFSGHAKTGQKWAKEFDQLDEWMENMYLARIHEKQPQFPIQKLRKLLDHDTFLTPEASILMGLCDKVLGGDDEVV
jgi:ATP-dependent Clp endopeptidase proteolytic subunit ClpP